ncbi:MAG: hypothetical protein JSW71_12320 [Gemmatimonadota bacterium]|nr:MAG: hypothetical protein JSW71_12320 [Gemmatimonadota bacterium]
MKRSRLAFVAATFLLPAVGRAQQEQAYDYFRFNRDMIQHDVQAILTCNRLLTSNRILEQVFQQELAYLWQPGGTPRGVYSRQSIHDSFSEPIS